MEKGTTFEHTQIYVRYQFKGQMSTVEMKARSKKLGGGRGTEYGVMKYIHKNVYRVKENLKQS